MFQDKYLDEIVVRDVIGYGDHSKPIYLNQTIECRVIWTSKIIKTFAGKDVICNGKIISPAFIKPDSKVIVDEVEYKTMSCKPVGDFSRDQKEYVIYF